MVSIQTALDAQQKLSVLSTDSQYDLACACGTNQEDRRHRGSGDRWIYPVTLPNGGQSVLFSAYQRGLGDLDLPGEKVAGDSAAILTREHRLYQVDWLMRKYGFEGGEIPFEADGSLSLDCDPKEAWARQHPERFPLDVNRATRNELLRVPGLGPVTVRRIMDLRRKGGTVKRLSDIGRPGKRFAKAETYLAF